MYKRKATLLIVDDDAAILASLKDVLSEEYKTILSASNGVEALDILIHQPVDLAIIDIMMPEMDGYELARKMKKEGINVPFIFLTAKGELWDKIVGLELGAEDFITKPFEEEEFILRINQKLFIHEKLELRNTLELIHHNILTPTGVIQGNAQLLENWLDKTGELLKMNMVSDSSYLISEGDWNQQKASFKKLLNPIYESLDQLIKMM